LQAVAWGDIGNSDCAVACHLQVKEG